MKRSYILALCIALCMTMTLATTISYLSDVDSDVNIMTLGNVRIDLMEFERMGEEELRDFSPFKDIYPLVGELGDVDGFGLPTNENFIDKMVLVASQARNANAYLRVYIGVPSALRNIDVGNGETIDAVHLYMGEDVTIDYGAPMYEGAWPWKADSVHDRQIEIDGVPYDMLCYNYTKLLIPDEVTPVLLGGVYMDAHVDNGDDDGYTIWHNGVEYPLEIDLNNGVQIPVYVQAVQAAGFRDRDHAFEESGMNDAPFDLHLIAMPDQPDGPDYPDDGLKTWMCIMPWRRLKTSPEALRKVDSCASDYWKRKMYTILQMEMLLRLPMR